MPEVPGSAGRSSHGFALKLACGYALVGTFYILASDRVLQLLVADPARITHIQSYKGWTFVAVTAGLLFMVVRRFVRSIETASAELAQALDTQRRLTRELNHRVRNNLASLVAIINLGSQGRPALAPFAESIVGRVRAMGAAFSMLSEARWQPVSLRSVVALATDVIASCRELDGPEVTIQHDRIVPLMLVLHELASNATRHGCARAPGGRVRIRWRLDAAPPAPDLVLTWTEHDGPAVSPAELGLGLQMAQGMATSDLQGRLDIAWSPGGVEYTLRVPVGVAPARTLETPA